LRPRTVCLQCKWQCRWWSSPQTVRNRYGISLD